MKVTYDKPSGIKWKVSHAPDFGKKVKIVVVLDRSGSMNAIRDKTIDGYNEYLNGLEADSNTEYWISLYQFDSNGSEPELTVTYENCKLVNAHDLTRQSYSPRGGTPLYDAIGECIERVDRLRSIRTANDAPVVFVVITDGEENTSREFDKRKVKSLIETKTALGWTFTFLGTGIDSYSEASSIGMGAGSTSNFTPNNTHNMYMGLANSTITRSASYRNDGASANTADFFTTLTKSSMGDTRDPLNKSCTNVTINALDAQSLMDAINRSPTQGSTSTYMTPEQVAETLQIDRRTVYNKLKSGELKGTKLGDSWRIKSEDLP